MIDTILSSKRHFNLKQRRHCFELLGYDFIIDEDFRLWLLEVNNNPDISFNNNDHYTVIGHVINNSLKIALNPLLEGSPLHMTGRTAEETALFEENKFELVYSDA